MEEAMSNSKGIERLWKLEAKVNMMVLDGKRDAEEVADALQAILEHSVSKFKLYRHGDQGFSREILAADREKHLEETGRIDRCVSLDDEQVKEWLAYPSTYPEKFKLGSIFLWNSQRDIAGQHYVASLIWNNEQVAIEWRLLMEYMNSGDMTLLRNS
jgi:hypothetical protein